MTDFDDNINMAARNSDASPLKVIGFLSFLTWGFSCLFTLPQTLGSHLYLEALGFAGLTVGLSIIYLFSDSRKALSSVLLPILCLGATLFCFLIVFFKLYIPLPLFCAASFIMGTASAYLFVSWTDLLSRAATQPGTVLIILEMSLAALLGFLLTTASSAVALYVTLFSFALSASLLIPLFTQQAVVISQVERKVSKKRRPMGWKTHIMFGFFGMAFGIGLFGLAGYGTSILTALAVVIGCLGCFIDINQAGGVYPDRMKRILIVCMVGAFLLTSLTSDLTQRLCWNLFPAFIAYFFALQFNWIIYSSHRFQLNTAAFLPEAHVLIWTGFGLGFGIAWVFFLFDLMSTMLSAVMIFLLVFSIAILTATDLEGLALLVFKDFDQNEDSFTSKKAPFFVKRCNEISHSFGLTQREQEIMMYLAKGRNAEYISNKLTLSKYTVKTHIYHIYQKLDISSHQALIDMVENYFK